MPEGVKCYTQLHTIADDLDCIYCKTTTGSGEVQVPCKFYGVETGGAPGMWSAFQAIKRVFHNGKSGDCRTSRSRQCTDPRVTRTYPVRKSVRKSVRNPALSDR
jgi:hypothetical protein